MDHLDFDIALKLLLLSYLFLVPIGLRGAYKRRNSFTLKLNVIGVLVMAHVFWLYAFTIILEIVFIPIIFLWLIGWDVANPWI